MTEAKHASLPWRGGGPVTRESIMKVLTGGTGPNGLSEEVWEIGRDRDDTPPAICIVNDYFDPETGVRIPAKDHAHFIVTACNCHDELLTACEEALEGFRLTREYVGEATLPAIEGWSWFDASAKLRAAIAKAKATP